MKTITLLVNKEIGNKKPGDTIVLEVDKQGTIKDQYWRRRFKDSEIDNCVEIFKKVKEKANE